MVESILCLDHFFASPFLLLVTSLNEGLVEQTGPMPVVQNWGVFSAQTSAGRFRESVHEWFNGNNWVIG